MSRMSRAKPVPWRALGFVLVAASCLLVLAGGCDAGVTSDCPPMPVLDPTTGEPEGPTRWSDASLGPGGALNRWWSAAAAEGCASLPPSTAGAGNAGGAP